MAVRLAASAERDLLAIADRVSDTSPGAALALVARLEAAWRRIGQFPRLGHTHADIPSPYLLTVGRWLIIYRIDETPIPVVRIVDGRQDLQLLGL